MNVGASGVRRSNRILCCIRISGSGRALSSRPEKRRKVWAFFRFSFDFCQVRGRRACAFEVVFPQLSDTRTGRIVAGLRQL